MKKFVGIFGSCLLALSVFTACGGATSSAVSSAVSSQVSSVAVSSSSAASSQASSVVSSSTVESTAASTAVNVEGLGETLDMNAIQIALDGTVFTFPGATYAEFESAGWSVAPGYAGTTVPANSSGTIEFVKGENTIELSMSNFGTTPIPLEQCIVQGIHVDDSMAKGMSVVSPGNMQLTVATPEEIAALYGEPQSKYPSDQPITAETSSLEYKDFDIGSAQYRFYDGNMYDIRIHITNDVFR